MVKHLSHPMHTGGSSPFNKKEWVRKEWPMCNRAITVSSFLFFPGQNIHSFNTGNIWYNLFSGNSSHSDCHSSNIYLFVRGFRSENGMSSQKINYIRYSQKDNNKMQFYRVYPSARLPQKLTLLWEEVALGWQSGWWIYPIKLHFVVFFA